MISKECFTTEWITQKSIELQYNDKNLIEKVIRAFSLLEMLSYDDIRQTALNISTRGFVDKDKFALLQKGIINIKPFMYKGAYRIEEAIIDAAKAAYLATVIETGCDTIERFTDAQLAEDLLIKPVLTNKLNKLRIGLPEAYFYWAKTSQLMK